MRHTVLAIFFVLAFAFISCSADEAVNVEKLSIQDKISNTFNNLQDKAKAALHLNQQQEEVIEVQPEEDRGFKGRLQDGLQRAGEKINGAFNSAQENIKGRFQSQPEEVPVVEEAEPSFKDKVNGIISNLGDSIHTIEDKVKDLFNKEEAPQEPIQEENTEKGGIRERLQQGFDSASGKVKGLFNREGDNAEQVQEQAQETQEELSLKDRIVNKVKDALHMDEKTLPPKVGETVQNARETVHHAKEAAHEGAEAARADSMKDRVQHAYQAVREGIKGFGTAKDVVVNTNEVPVEGGKDSLKETIKLAMSKENLKGKFDEAKEFMKTEAQDSIRIVKDKLSFNKEQEPEPVVEQPEPTFVERLVDALYSATSTFKKAVGMGKEEEKSSDL